MKRLICLAAVCLLWVGGAAASPLRIAFVGDIMLDDGPGRFAAQGGDPLVFAAPAFAGADYRIANLETSVAKGGAANPNMFNTFRATPATLRSLNGRVDAVTLANNHSGDYGQDAFMETIDLLNSAGIAHFGGGKNLREAHSPLWIKKNGLKIALLGYNEYKPRSFEAGPNWPGIAWSEDSHVVADILAARKAGADIIIPFMHWGWELEPHSSERQRQLAHLMIRAGATAVVGSHPHVTEETEIYRGRPIIYSLGNFVFDGFDEAPERTGWMLRMNIDRQGVVSWDTLEFGMDDDGIPHPHPDARTPCATKRDKQPKLCQPTQ